MTRHDMVAAIEAASGQTITAMAGRNSGIIVTLSDGRAITIERRRVKAAKSADELRAYIEGLL